MREYQVQMKWHGGWLRGSWRGGHPVPVKTSYEDALAAMREAVRGWTLDQPSSRLRPDDWRIVSRSVTAWEVEE